MHMDNIKLFTKNENKLETIIDGEDIESGYRDGISHRKCTMQIMKSRKRQMTEEMERPNQEKSDCLEKRKVTNT